MKAMGTLVLLTFLLQMPAPVEPKHFLYVSDQRIVTVELVDSRNLLMNYVNLGDSFEVLAAHQVVLIDSAGDRVRGHLFKLENVPDPSRPYAVTELVRPGQYAGYMLTGNFELRRPLAQVLFRVGGRILELEPLSGQDFELAASRIGRLDLTQRDRKIALQGAGFHRGFGSMVFAGGDRAEDLARHFSDESVLPPVALATPPPRLPSSESHLADPVLVRLRVIVSRSGGLRDVQTLEGISEKLNEIAVETVRNSWIFLPAISGNALAEAEVTLNVVFRRQ